MKLKNMTDRSRKRFFDEYASPEHDYAFDTTVVPVKMAEISPNDLVSHSQANAFCFASIDSERWFSILKMSMK